MKRIIYIGLICLISHSLSAQEKTNSNMLESKEVSTDREEKKDHHKVEKIKWMSFEEAVKANKSNPKKFFIDVYTDWCGWCKKMDATTFRNPEIVSYINEHYHAVKLDAEMKDTVRLDDKIFVNENPDRRRSTHQLAISLLNGRLSYPSIVYLDESGNMLQPIAGYQDAKSLEPIIKFFGDDAFKETSWEEYQKQFAQGKK